MSDISDIAKENCRTCLSHFNENNEKCSLMNCLAMNFDDGQIELMKKVMTTCSITLFTEKEDETVSEEVFVCLPCVTEIDQMLNFLQKCIHSEVILKHASQLKTEASSVWIDDGQEQKETGIQAKVEGFHQELVAVSSQTTTEPPGENPKHEHQGCHKKFSSPLLLTFPRYKHSGHKQHTCIICNENFKTHQLIKRHMVAEHEDTHSQQYSCRQCSKVFPSKYYLNLHKLKIHTKKYPCSVCKWMFASVSSLKFHENVHMGKQIHSCPSCSKSFVSDSVLRKHENSFHADANSFRCHCERSSNVEVHVESVHEKDKSRKYSCPVCDKKFQRPYSLRDHINSHRGVKPFLCNACGSAFTALTNLTSHIKRIHSGDKKPVVKKYLCHTCGVSFARAAHLKRHTLRKHVPNPEKKHECPICKKKFLEKSGVTGHIKLHDDVKPFVCEDCSKCFKTGWRLRAHVNRVHLGLRPFECPSCSVKFKTKCNLEKHIRTHTGEKPFPCPHCNYTCAEKSNLKKHINKHLNAM